MLDRSIKAAVTRHVLDLAILAGLLMILLGSLFGGRPVVTFGWTVFAIALGVRVLVNLAGNWIRNGKWWWIGVAIAGALLVLVGIEGLLLASGTKRWLGLFLLGVACGLVLAIITKKGSSAIAVVLTAVVVDLVRVRRDHRARGAPGGEALQPERLGARRDRRARRASPARPARADAARPG